MDRGLLDFERVYRFHEAGSFFVTRGKSNLKVRRRYSHPVDRETGLKLRKLSDCYLIFVAQFRRKKALAYDFPKSARQRKVAKSQGALRRDQRTLRSIGPIPRFAQRRQGCGKLGKKVVGTT
jgi:hypothetical protein